MLNLPEPELLKSLLQPLLEDFSIGLDIALLSKLSNHHFNTNQQSDLLAHQAGAKGQNRPDAV